MERETTPTPASQVDESAYPTPASPSLETVRTLAAVGVAEAAVVDDKVKEEEEAVVRRQPVVFPPTTNGLDQATLRSRLSGKKLK